MKIMNDQQKEQSGINSLVAKKSAIKQEIGIVEAQMGGNERTEVRYKMDLTTAQIAQIEAGGKFGVRYAESWTHPSGDTYTKWAIYPMFGVMTAHTIFHPDGRKSDNPLLEKRHELFCKWVELHRQLNQLQKNIVAIFEEHKRSLLTNVAPIGSYARDEHNRMLFTNCPF